MSQLKKILEIIKKVAIVTAIGVGEVVAAPSMISAAGFKAGGVKAGSITAARQENIGNVAADLCNSIECTVGKQCTLCDFCFFFCMKNVGLCLIFAIKIPALNCLLDQI